METKTIQNKQFSLKWRDWLIGAGIAVATGVFTVVYDTMMQGSLNFDWQLVKAAAISAFAAYIGKNFFEKTKTVTIVKE